MLPKYTTYGGKQYRLMRFSDAVAEYDAQKEKGKKPVIISTRDGYIVSEAIFDKPGEEGGKADVG